ncbi:3-deoxy-manno-octulosonate cytidylyltransferase [Rhodoblastus sphagnicola]|uniref:3-deoxy-manno-octulosonate cytidylyltransferase n=1 Tax=Rhodoblastus sphagnicola TaxID=333368 RepID=A0A2S6N9U4_9HYPH|nr:3-deoxy-manno-octulosonate cytidylyltransferase [Rhodoblastus sphagnicola]MBB4198749.1 3-deoxy-manno-octulosonate cytidylyltransferase (CMP-KDO synthetase) [Rhodoblastus sphagnicola]PPQ31388.1 3-deoxy-manno-octulosonate cytidylyltransferase [Rhodoblastus sphagnicola]
MRSIIVIPARYQSSRLPGKPLIDLCGKSMIQRTFERCALGFPKELIHVATDDDRVLSHCQALGINVLMTSPHCLTGTDRVAEVARTVEADLYINVQGDEPLFNPGDIGVMLDVAAAHPGEVLNGVAPIESEDQFRSPTIPKVVMRPDGRLLYMSRGSVPTNKTLAFVRAWRQICIYAFPPDALRAFAGAPAKTPLEVIEDIEILRFLELGYDVRMAPLSADSIAVDTPEDAGRVRTILKKLESVH